MTSSPPVIWLDEVDSTNEEARRRLVDGLHRAVWIAARQQTAGRGRLGRGWTSPSGNLFASAIVRVPGGPGMATRLPFAAALAVHDTLGAFAPRAALRLKWPNDVRVDAAKICGILVETLQVDDVIWAIAGIGINVAHAPQAVGQAATALAELRGDMMVTAEMVLQGLVAAFEQRRAEAFEDFPATRTAWLARAEGLGGEIAVTIGRQRLVGVFEDMAEDGGLVLGLPDGGRRIIRAGDVELVKQADGHASGD